MRRGFERYGFTARCALLRQLARTGWDVSSLLPRADGGWELAAAQVHLEAFSMFAQQHGVSRAMYMAHAQQWLETHVATAEVRLRMRVGNFEKFLVSGRYRTQFDPAAAPSGGAKHRAIRMMLEHTVLGVPPSAEPRDRPIYGYLSGSDEAGLLQQYGEVVLRLRPSVRRRSTFMLGDSLDHAITHFDTPAFVPRPVSAPTTAALTPYDIRNATSLADAAPPYGYAEAQVYGGITPRDVRMAVYTLNTPPSATALALLGRLGVQWDVTPEYGP